MSLLLCVEREPSCTAGCESIRTSLVVPLRAMGLLLVFDGVSDHACSQQERVSGCLFISHGVNKQLAK